METLIINIPEQKSDLVKTLLTELGVTFKKDIVLEKTFKEQLTNSPTWTEENFEDMELAAKSFDSLKPAKW